MANIGDVEKRLLMRIQSIDETQAGINSAKERMRGIQIIQKRVSQGELVISQNRLESLNHELGVRKQQVAFMTEQIRNNKIIARQEKDQIARAHQFKMEYLGILFAGMALQRATDRFLRSAITTYNEAFEETSALEQQTNKLTAAWKFFQFSLIDALSKSPFFMRMVEFAIGLLNAFSNLNNGVKTGFIATMAAAWAAGGALSLLGQMALGGLSLQVFWQSGVLQNLASKFDEIKIGGLSLRDAAAIGFAIKAVFDLGQTIEEGGNFSDMLNSIEDELLAVAVLKGNVWTISIAVIIKFREELEALGDATKGTLDDIAVSQQRLAADSDSIFEKIKRHAIAGVAGGVNILLMPFTQLPKVINSFVDDLDDLKTTSDTVTDSINESMAGDENSVKSSTEDANESVVNFKNTWDSLESKTITLTVIEDRISRSSESARGISDKTNQAV